MPEKERLIERIVEAELHMFVSVPSRYPVLCQHDPEGFRLHRGAQFSVWSEDTLQSYYDDLMRAGQQGSNLMTLKYARMENLIPPLSMNPLIDEIVDLQLRAQGEMKLRYPHIVSRGRPLEDEGSGPTSFRSYLRGELETYSDRTIELLHRDILQTEARGDNWSILTHSRIVEGLGYKSLDQVEELLREKNG
jgi:hypothetical protein